MVAAVDGLRLIANYSGEPDTPGTLPVMVRWYGVGERPPIVFISRSSDPLLSGVRMLATIQVSLRNRNGRTFVHGLKPMTPSYSLFPRNPHEERAYSLLRIV